LNTIDLFFFSAVTFGIPLYLLTQKHTINTVNANSFAPFNHFAMKF